MIFALGQGALTLALFALGAMVLGVAAFPGVLLVVLEVIPLLSS